MDYKKKYNEAMGIAEEIIRYYKEHNRGDENSIEDLESIFPELKESEDEKVRKALIRFHKSTIDVDGIKGEDIIAWLEKQATPQMVEDAFLKGCNDTKKCLLKRQSEQKPWSVVDMSKIQRICMYLDEAKKYYADITEVRECIDWLKSLKDRVQPKQEWSKGDMDMLNAAISFVKHSSFTTIGKGKNNTVAWLKSLKDRYTWKPSKGQLECLGYAIDKAEKEYSPLANNRIYLTLKALKEELEKLKG